MSIPLKDLFKAEQLERFCLKLIAGEGGLDRVLSSSRVQKPGLILAGLLDELHPDRIQIFGAAEIGYLEGLAGEAFATALGPIERGLFPAVVVTRDARPPDKLVEICRNKETPLFITTLTSAVFIEGITKYLEERFAPSITIHGVLMDVLGAGILITGKSGIGKSECALEMISKGYRLVSDDVVVVRRMPHSILFGSSVDLVRYHMEIRGLGIVNIKDIFGITAIRDKKQMDLVVELVKWEPESEYERLGFEERSYDILGVSLPYLRVPVIPGRSVSTILEVAARNQILKIMGQNPTMELQRNLDEALKEPVR
jgi:HPr kinase/phosphorylase